MSMHQHFRRLLLALGMAIVAASTASAQPSVSEPEFVPYTNDLQLFEQPDLSRYGNGVRAPEGWFGSAEYLNWSLQAPGKTTIGNDAIRTQQVYAPGLRTRDTGVVTNTTINTTIIPNVSVTGVTTIVATIPPTLTITPLFIPLVINGINTNVPVSFTTPIPLTLTIPWQTTSASFQNITTGQIINNTGVDQLNNMSTAGFNSDFTSGGRFEFGRVVEGRGWFVSTFNLGSQTQVASGTDVAVNFSNSPVGFVDIRGPRVAVGAGNFNNNAFLGDGFDDDLDGDNVYGRFGRDRGTQAGATITAPLDGIPDPEIPGAPTLNIDFDDAVPLPTVFHELQATNRMSMYGVETQRLWRLPVNPDRGVWEVFLGPRYLNLDDAYEVVANGINSNPQYYLNPIADAEWTTAVQNNVLGAQLGGRWQFQRDRWGVTFEGRFLGAANFQNMKQTGHVGSRANSVVPTGAAPAANATVPFMDDVVNMQLGNGFSSSANDITFAPVGEIRAKLKYQLFRSVYISLGYTGMYADGIARASKLVNYTLPNFGILEQNNHEGMFINGLDLGLIINR